MFESKVPFELFETFLIARREKKLLRTQMIDSETALKIRFEKF